MRTVYLDHTATTPVDPRVLEAMKPYFLETFGNASSIHSFGQRARAALDESRDTLARLLGVSAGELFFVGSGTEADNFALKGVAWKMRERGKTHIITSAIEHHAVLESCAFLEQNGFEVTYLGVDRFGTVDTDLLRDAIRPSTGLISVMHANNEVGTINPAGPIAAIARERGIPFHSDAVQTFGKIPLRSDEPAPDLLSVSAHKIYGPKGIGALVIRKEIPVERLIHGGGQERGKRGGTENVPLAVGFASAALLVEQEREAENLRLLELKGAFRMMLEAKFPSLLFNGHPVHSLPHIVNVSFDSRQADIDGEALLFNMDMAGIAVTSGSACTSGSLQPSHVLLAMGRDPRTARGTIRFSMGRSTTRDDLRYAVDMLEQIVARLAPRFLA